jgi:hypothetical protein
VQLNDEMIKGLEKQLETKFSPDIVSNMVTQISTKNKVVEERTDPDEIILPDKELLQPKEFSFKIKLTPR